MRGRAIILFLMLGVTGASLGQSTESATSSMLEQHRLIALLRRATQLYDEKRYKESLACLDTLSGNATQDLSVRNMRGNIFAKLGDYGQAQQLFQEIIKENPTYFPAVFNLGEVQFMQGDYESALHSFSAMYAQDPRNEIVRFKLLLVHLLLGHQEEAEKMAATLIPVGGTPAWYYAQAMLAKKSDNLSLMKKNIATAQEIYGEKGCRDFEEAIRSIKF